MKQELNETLLNQTQGLNVSSKYTVVKTQEVLAPLLEQGYTIASSVATKVRSQSKEGFQKHMIRLAHANLKLRNVNDSRPEIVIVNSYDGLSSLKIMLGIYRLVCANGMIVGSTFGQFRTRHVGDIGQYVTDGAKKIAASLPEVSERIKSMESVQLSRNQALELAETASKLVLPSSAILIDFETALKINRVQDAGLNLWLVYNRLQESLVRGGIKYSLAATDLSSGALVIKNNTTRGIKSIDRQVEVNQKLWDLTQKLAA